MKDYTINMSNISIEFPGVKALDNAHFTMQSGRVHALIGANGAGKSTLMKVLSGAYNHWTGKIQINGKDTNIRSTEDAKDLGIQIVYQEVDVALIPYLSVAENIMLDEMVNGMKGKQLVNWTYIKDNARKVLKRLNVNISVDKKVSDLSLAEKQMVLISRAIQQKCSLLILDEPTAPLSNNETEELFRVVRELKDDKVGVIFISHRLPELFVICDDVTVMRDGKFISEKLIAETNEVEVVEDMLGRSLNESFPKVAVDIGNKVFEVKKLSDSHILENINVHVNKGEIIGIAGLVGAGKTELCKAIFGAVPITSGEIYLHNKKINIQSPYHAVINGLALVPEERRKEGILVHEPVYSNLTIPSLNNFTNKGIVDFKKEYKTSRDIIKKLGIKTPNEFQKVEFLSGGNQQKIAVGKWLIADAEVYIFDEPTKGVDIGAKTDIFNLVGELVSNGKCVIYATCETNEILGISDRVYVMYDGKIAKEFVTKDTSEDEILYYSAGGK